MGFFNLLVTVTGHASAADISATTRPFFACPSVPAISTRVWWTTRNSPACAAPTGRPETDQAPKRGTEAPPNPSFGLLIRYQDLTPQTLPPNHPQG